MKVSSLLFNFFHIQESVAIHRRGVTCKVTPYLNFILALAFCLYFEAHRYLDLGIVNNLNSLEARLVYNFPLLIFGLPTTVLFSSNLLFNYMRLSLLSLLFYFMHAEKFPIFVDAGSFQLNIPVKISSTKFTN